MSAGTSESIYELRQAATYAALNYEIWWVYKSPDTRPVFVDTMNRYTILFQTAIHAHFVAMIVALYRIFETRKDTHNFEQLLDTIVAEFHAEKPDIQRYRSRFETLKPTWIKIARLRNDAFGHRSSNSTIKQVFDAVAVSPDEFRDFIESTKGLLNDVSAQYLRSSHEFNTGAREQALEMLTDLQAVGAADA